MFCPNCGFPVPTADSYNFCPKCGSKLVVPVNAPTVIEVAAEPAVPTYGIGNSTPLQEVTNRGIQKKILIVEDDLFIRELYQKQLEISGYEVDAAVDGVEGRDKAFGKVFDLILLDIMLPKMNGLDLLKLLKETDKTKAVPVIILSNLGQDSVVEKGLSLGAINYIVKADITPMEMLKVIQEKIGAS